MLRPLRSRPPGRVCQTMCRPPWRREIWRWTPPSGMSLRSPPSPPRQRTAMRACVALQWRPSQQPPCAGRRRHLPQLLRVCRMGASMLSAPLSTFLLAWRTAETMTPLPQRQGSWSSRTSACDGEATRSLQQQPTSTAALQHKGGPALPWRLCRQTALRLCQEPCATCARRPSVKGGTTNRGSRTFPPLLVKQDARVARVGNSTLSACCVLSRCLERRSLSPYGLT
mmetsp:Transcript_4974/g.12824  ORF Transcript_4974/g.12824 Transcript_4974/m.12824 type:complete len:226 (+) Transcript_4974:308-985(+)